MSFVYALDRRAPGPRIVRGVTGGAAGFRTGLSYACGRTGGTCRRRPRSGGRSGRVYTAWTPGRSPGA